MTLPSPLELASLALAGADRVTTFGDDDDPFTRVTDDLVLDPKEETLVIDRKVVMRAPVDFIVFRFEVSGG